MPEVVLGGSRTEPLGSYLKALGVFRLVAEQADSHVKGYWKGDRFVLSTRLTEDELRDFFLERYVPTPVIAPWNSRSITAFESAKATDLSAIDGSIEERFAPLRDTIGAARAVLDDVRKLGIEPRSKKAADKQTIVRLCRARFPDAALPWLDAVVVLTRSVQAYPPVTGGAGGVLGSGDLSLNFLDHLRTVVEPTPESPRYRSVAGNLTASLYGQGRPDLVSGMSGQFDPGAAGGVNVGRELVNPWDFILLIEGALLITAGVARRLGVDKEGEATFPFTVRSVPAGFGSAADEEDSRGEIWIPVWRRPAYLGEVRRLFTEGRATWRGSQARTALDFARAAGALGVDRGIDLFVRYVVSERLGQSNLAVPVGRFVVRERRGVPVLAQIDPWLASLRRVRKPPAAVSSALRAVERALYTVSDEPTALNLQGLLVAVARLEGAVSRSGSTRKNMIPLFGLKAQDWVPLLEDGSNETALALGLASARNQVSDGAGHLRRYLSPVEPSTRGLSWTDRPALVPGLGQRPIFDVLTACLTRRVVEATQRASGESSESPGVHLGSGATARLPLPPAALFFSGLCDMQRVEELLSGLLVLDWRGWKGSLSSQGQSDAPVVPPAFSLLVPFGHGRPIPYDGRSVELRMPIRWPALLTAGRVEEVCGEAIHRLRVARLSPAVRAASVLASGIDGTHLGSALLAPLTDVAARSLLARAVVPDQSSVYASKEGV